MQFSTRIFGKIWRKISDCSCPSTGTCFIQKMYAPSPSLLQGKHLPFSPSPLRLNIFLLFVILSLTILVQFVWGGPGRYIQMWQSKREISRECNDIIGSAKGSQIREKYWGEVGKGKRVDVYLEVRKRRGHIFFECNKCLCSGPQHSPGSQLKFTRSRNTVLVDPYNVA